MPLPNFDLHSHSNVSDGTLTPAELVERAAARGVGVLALTDHDDTGGLEDAWQAAVTHGIRLVGGVEVSVSWQAHTLHVVGLGIDPAHAGLAAGLAALRAGRRERAEKIAAQLARFGIAGSLEGAWRHAGPSGLIGRMHFARFLVETGVCKDVQAVFRRYLSKDKPGHVSHRWVELGDAVSWIRASGGRAVLAHPGRYRLGSGRMETLLQEFRAAGGEGIEVVSGSHTPDQFARFALFAQKFGLLASRGSDFHSPDETYRDLGRLAPLPERCTPVWHDWNLD